VRFLTPKSEGQDSASGGTTAEEPQDAAGGEDIPF
jgi:hypothetical protein